MCLIYLWSTLCLFASRWEGFCVIFAVSHTHLRDSEARHDGAQSHVTTVQMQPHTNSSMAIVWAIDVARPRRGHATLYRGGGEEEHQLCARPARRMFSPWTVARRACAGAAPRERGMPFPLLPPSWLVCAASRCLHSMRRLCRRLRLSLSLWKSFLRLLAVGHDWQLQGGATRRGHGWKLRRGEERGERREEMGERGERRERERHGQNDEGTRRARSGDEGA